MVKWDYGREGQDLNVEPGDVWKIGDDILVGCGDLDMDALPKMLDIVDAEQIGSWDDAMVYTDPPWNRGVAAAFRTKAGYSAAVDFDQLIRNIIRPLIGRARTFWVEGSVREKDHVLELLQDCGLGHVVTYDIFYNRNQPCVLFEGAFSFDPDWRSKPLTNLDDTMTLQTILRHTESPPTLLVDPCTGRGLMPRIAATAGIPFAGVELHPRRLAVAIARTCSEIETSAVKLDQYQLPHPGRYE